MLEYFGIKGAKTADDIEAGIQGISVVELDRKRGMEWVRKLRILSCLDPVKITPLSTIYLASKALYGVMKDILDELEEEDLVTSRLYIKGHKKVATKQYLITQKGIDYVEQYKTEDCEQLPGTRKRDSTGQG